MLVTPPPNASSVTGNAAQGGGEASGGGMVNAGGTVLLHGALLNASTVDGGKTTGAQLLNGGRVVYAIGDLEAWADQAACSSTSDPRYLEARAASNAHR